jgi:hypothetical protein
LRSSFSTKIAGHCLPERGDKIKRPDIVKAGDYDYAFREREVESRDGTLKCDHARSAAPSILQKQIERICSLDKLRGFTGNAGISR